MNLKAALLTTAATGAILVAGCGGGSSDAGVNSAGATPSGPSGAGSSSSACVPQAPVTIAGGNLFVAAQGPVGITLLSDGGLAQYEFTFYYDFVYGISTNNPQDKWGQARPFAPGTPVGTSTQLQLQPPTPDLIQFQPMPATFPKGIPVELVLRKSDGNPASAANSSSTASIGKDLLGRDAWRTADVTYGANDTAVVTFFPADAGAHFSVGLTNVFGSGSPAGGC